MSQNMRVMIRTVPFKRVVEEVISMNVSGPHQLLLFLWVKEQTAGEQQVLV